MTKDYNKVWILDTHSLNFGGICVSFNRGDLQGTFGRFSQAELELVVLSELEGRAMSRILFSLCGCRSCEVNIVSWVCNC